jgi:hypothetical protein
LAKVPWTYWVFICALVVAWGVGVSRALRGHGSDFDGFWAAAHHVWIQGTLSTAKDVERYPPSFQLLLTPLGAVPLLWAVVLWNTLNLAALIDLPRLFEKFSGVPKHTQLLAWAIMLPFAIDNLVLGQSGPVLLWLTTVGVFQARKSRPFRAGWLLGLATCIKVIPVVFLVLGGVLRKRSRLLVGALGAVIVAVTVGTIVLDKPEQQLGAVRSWWQYVWTRGSMQGMVERGHSLRYTDQAVGVVIARTFADIKQGKTKEAISLGSLSLKTVVWLTRAVRAIAILLWLVAAWQTYKLGTDLAWFRLFVMTALAMLAGSPIVWTHYFLWLAPASVYLLSRRSLAFALLILVWLGLLFVPAQALGVHIILVLATIGLLSHDCWSDYKRQKGRPEPATA